MKRLILIPAVVLAAAIFANLSRAESGEFAVTEQGADYRILQKTTLENGTNRVHKYTEVATGLNYLTNGQWQESKEQIDILPNGTAQAVQGQHQAYFPGDIYNGEIELATPDGQQLHSRPVGLSYSDGENSVLIAELTNSVGMVVGSNQVIYPNAFTDFKADLRYTYKKGGFEQEVVFQEQPPSPESFGLNSQTARLQLLTEFFNTAEPTQTTTAANQQDGLQDKTLAFGEMKMIQGKAFTIGDSSPGTQHGKGIPVYKSWLQLSGRTFLVEELPCQRIKAQLEQLPMPGGGNISANSIKSPLHKISTRRLLPNIRLVQVSANTVRLAKAEVNYKSGVVLDYMEVNSDYGLSDFTFQSNTTYYISSSVFIGSGTIQGGAVIKFGRSGSLNFDRDEDNNDSIQCETDPDHPSIFTAVDDDSIGNVIDESTGAPSGYYASGTDFYEGLTIYSGSYYLHDLRFKYMDEAFGDVAYSITLDDIQFENCGLAFLFDSAVVTANNCLFYNVGTIMDATGTVSDASDTVTVNEVTATVNEDGSWEATNVLVSPAAIAVLNVQVSDSDNNLLGSATPDTTNVYLVRACASEFSTPYAPYTTIVDGNGWQVFFSVVKPALYAGDVPLPPEWLQIQGQTLINSGITNADGSVWGLALISVPANTNGDVTPTAAQVHSNLDYTFQVQVCKTKEDWQQEVRNEIYTDTSGAVDMNTYNAANGFMANRTNLQAVYAFYQKLFTENTNLLWAGLGKLAGAPVYAGLSDAENTKANPVAMLLLHSVFGIDTNDLTAFQNTLITMNTNILQDLAWQSEAYYKGGLQALNVIYAGETNALDSDTINAWREIDDGISNNVLSEIQNGNLQLAHREQLTILQPNYDTLNAMGGGITSFMSILAKNPVPTGTDFSTVVSGGNLSVFADRWNWITDSAGGIWPSWVAASSTTQSGWVNIPLTTRAINYANTSPVQ